jgi:hypothetical protein
MAEQISITSPVRIESDCKSRVALDFMNTLAYKIGDENQRKDKKFWFTLYRQCYKAVDGFALEQILREE